MTTTLPTRHFRGLVTGGAATFVFLREGAAGSPTGVPSPRVKRRAGTVKGGGVTLTAVAGGGPGGGGGSTTAAWDGAAPIGTANGYAVLDEPPLDEPPASGRGRFAGVWLEAPAPAAGVAPWLPPLSRIVSAVCILGADGPTTSKTGRLRRRSRREAGVLQSGSHGLGISSSRSSALTLVRLATHPNTASRERSPAAAS